MTVEHPRLPLPDRWALSDAEMLARAETALARFQRRHSIRDFSDRPVPREVVEREMSARRENGVRETTTRARSEGGNFNFLEIPREARAKREGKTDDERRSCARVGDGQWG